MRTLGIATLLVIAASFCALAATESGPTARTESGVVEGTVKDGVKIYLGIPFAAPPVGDLRWRAPLPPASWSGIRHADKFAPACAQNPSVNRALDIPPITTSEDCLYLNVWTPAQSSEDQLAVMVWIYGGGFTGGATSYPVYDGLNLAKKGVVVVSVAYRLNAFGFLAHPQLSAESNGHSGNYGLLDQLEALRWVQRNIAAFGGDPLRVTIFGESAGGVSVSMLAGSPLAGGLFSGAISESGGFMTPPRLANEGGLRTPPLALAERNGQAFLAKLGVSSIAEARKLPVESILKAVSPGVGDPTLSPNLDGYVLPGDQYKLYQAGRYNDAPVLIGTNSDEGAAFVRSTTAAAYQAGVRSGYGEYADKILAAYPAGSEAEALRSARDLARDTNFAWNTWTWARLQSKTGASKAFVYYFNHRPPYPDTPQFKDWGPAHGGEMAFVFGNFAGNVTPTPADRAVSDAMMSYWVNFANTGDPNGKGLPEWPAYSDAKPQAMHFDNVSNAGPYPNLDKLRALDGYYAWRRQLEASH